MTKHCFERDRLFNSITFDFDTVPNRRTAIWIMFDTSWLALTGLAKIWIKINRINREKKPKWIIYISAPDLVNIIYLTSNGDTYLNDPKHKIPLNTSAIIIPNATHDSRPQQTVVESVFCSRVVFGAA